MKKKEGICNGILAIPLIMETGRNSENKDFPTLLSPVF